MYPSDAAINAAIKSEATPIDKQDDVSLGKRLLESTRPFAKERVVTSWWNVLSTFTLMVAALTGAGILDWWPLRTVLATLGALLMVRAFIAYHDYMHGAILRESRLASILFHLYGAFALTPARSWKKSHNHHHGHVGRLTDETIGAFPIITTTMWRKSSRAGRAAYRASRHPLIILFGYITVFGFSVTLLPLLRDPKGHWDSGLSILLHGGLITLLWLLCGFDASFFAILLPMTIASILGSYLFFAQHSFRQMRVLAPASWSFYRAALVSSSYLRLNRVMRYFTGNIGYHHVHHLNVRIPFYRLPEAMAGIPELRTPFTTSLAISEIIACFRSCLWDEDRQRMVSYREARNP
jgi:omega-6 fatty acid desaturase (delta-12 desaturase)